MTTTSNVNPYDLSATRGIRIETARIDVAKQAIVDRHTGKLFEVTEEHRGVAEFEHPLLFKTPSVDGWRVAIDTRPFRGSSPMVKEQLDVLRTRAALTLHCATEEGCEHLFDPGLMMSYAHVVSGLLARQFNLDPLAKMNVTIAAAFFYFLITRTDKWEFKEDDLLMAATQIVRHLKVPAGAVESVSSLIVPGRTLQSLVDTIKAVEGTDRTMMLSPAVLISACSGLWFGVNSDMMLGILLEHPPTFAAVIVAATGEGNYSRVELAKRLKANTQLRQKIPHTHSVVNQLVQPYLAEQTLVW